MVLRYYTSKYPPVGKALQSLKHDIIIDGEVVVFNMSNEWSNFVKISEFHYKSYFWEN